MITIKMCVPLLISTYRAIPSQNSKLVQLLQQHKQSSYCERRNSCWFSLPKPPSPNTLIAQPESDPDVVTQAQAVLPEVHKVLANSVTMSTQIELTDGFGKMNKHKEAVIRFRGYNKASIWYRAKLMLYYPWYDEQADLLGGYSTYESIIDMNSTVLANESKYSQANVDDCTEESRSQSLEESFWI